MVCPSNDTFDWKDTWITWVLNYQNISRYIKHKAVINRYPLGIGNFMEFPDAWMPPPANLLEPSMSRSMALVCCFTSSSVSPSRPGDQFSPNQLGRMDSRPGWMSSMCELSFWFWHMPNATLAKTDCLRKQCILATDCISMDVHGTKALFILCLTCWFLTPDFSFLHVSAEFLRKTTSSWPKNWKLESAQPCWRNDRVSIDVLDSIC